MFTVVMSTLFVGILIGMPVGHAITVVYRAYKIDKAMSDRAKRSRLGMTPAAFSSWSHNLGRQS